MAAHLVRALEASGGGAAAELVAKLGTGAEVARELAYRLWARPQNLWVAAQWEARR